MDWNCTFTEERLSDYLEGKLLPVEAAAFSAHTADCSNCTETVALVGGLVNRMRKMPMVEEPPQLIAKILDATLGPRTQKESWFRWLGWISVLWQPRFVLGLGAAVASVVIVSYAAGLTPAKLKKADLSPANVFRSANRQAHLTYARGAKFVNDLKDRFYNCVAKSLANPILHSASGDGHRFRHGEGYIPFLNVNHPENSQYEKLRGL